MVVSFLAQDALNGIVCVRGRMLAVDWKVDVAGEIRVSFFRSFETLQFSFVKHGTVERGRLYFDLVDVEDACT